MTEYDSDSDNGPPYWCPTCGSPSVTRKGMRTHHVQVHGESLVKRETRECKHCGGEFEYSDSYHTKKIGLFCNRQCANDWKTEHPGKIAREVYDVDVETVTPE